MRAMPQTYVTVGVTLGVPGGPTGIFLEIRCVSLSLLCSFSGTPNTEGGIEMLMVVWYGDQTKTVFRVKHQGWKGVVCAFGGSRRLCHTVPFSCLGLWAVVRAGVLREGAKVQRKPASNVRPRPPQAQNMDQP